MSAAPAAMRGSFPIAAKLISFTTVLVALVVGLSAYLQLRATETIFTTEATRQRDETIAQTRALGTSTAQRVAASITPRILGSEWQTLQTETEQLVHSDAQLREAVISDIQRGLAVVHSDRAAVDHPYPRRLAGNPTIEESSEFLVIGVPVARDYALWLVYGYEELKTRLARIEERRQEGARRAVEQSLISGVGFLLLGIGLAIVAALRLSRPVKALTAAARRIAGGDLVSRSAVRTKDEIGELGATFNYMADRIELLMQETAEKMQLENELAVARAVQETLVPRHAIHDGRHLALAGYYQPASECGGDWWSFFELPGGKTVILIGDVTGHGVPSAMITAAAKSACDTVRAMSGDHFSLVQLMSAMNFAIYESARRTFVMTMFVALFDPVRRVVSFANAAHNFPYVLRGGGRGMSCLAARGNRLGDRLDSEYGIREEPAEPGDVFVFYTDGLVECTAPTGDEYGEKRLRRAIVDVAEHSVDSMRDRIVDKAMAFYGTEPRKDDITMVVARVKGDG